MTKEEVLKLESEDIYSNKRSDGKRRRESYFPALPAGIS